MNKFQLWIEGYMATGESGKAQYLGEFEAETLKDAVIAYKNTLTDPYSIKCVNIERLSYWGCKFYDNESDARKSYG
jgi:hypothetical protein